MKEETPKIPKWGDPICQKHGWWIEDDGGGLPALHCSLWEISSSGLMTGLGKKMGVLKAVTLPNPSTAQTIFITVEDEIQELMKYRLKRSFMMAKVPDSVRRNVSVMKMRGMKGLCEKWEELIEEEQKRRQDIVDRAKTLSQERIAFAKRLYREHAAYEALKKDSTTSHVRQDPPQDPEDMDPLYRIFARPVAINWHSQIHEVEVHEHISISLGKKSSKRTRDLGRGRDLESGRSLQSAEGSKSGRGPGSWRGSRFGRSSSSSAFGDPKIRRTKFFIDEIAKDTDEDETCEGSEEESEDEDDYVDMSENDEGDDSDEAFQRPSQHRRGTKMKKDIDRNISIVFPTSQQIEAGYIWGYDMVFTVKMGNVMSAMDPETNHRTLTIQRAKEIYDIIVGAQEGHIMPITLRPVKFKINIGTEYNSILKEIYFDLPQHAVEEFEDIFEKYGEGKSVEHKKKFLRRNVIWTPVDGQHIQHACVELAKDAFEKGEITRELFEQRFEHQKARFVVYNEPHVYIAASFAINQRNVIRSKYTTVAEGLLKLRNLWLKHGKPNPKDTADDKKRTLCLMESASALRNKVKISNITTMSVLRRCMDVYTRHAWQIDNKAFDSILQVCKDYDAGILHATWKESQAWLKYANENNVDSDCDIRKERIEMTINWLKPFYGLNAKDYKVLAHSAAAQPKDIDTGVRQPQRLFFNGVGKLKPDEGTVAYYADRMLRRSASRNALRWLKLQKESDKIISMREFLLFPIDDLLIEEPNKTLTFLGLNASFAFKKRWANPVRKTTKALKKFECLIPDIIQTHFTDRCAGYHGFVGQKRIITESGNSTWDCLFKIPVIDEGSIFKSISIKYWNHNMFGVEHMRISDPALWVLNCCQGSSVDGNEKWKIEDFKKIFQLIQQWMEGQPRWNVILLLHGSFVVDEKFILEMEVPNGAIIRRGIWGFHDNFGKSQGNDDIKYGMNVIGKLEELGDIIFIFHRPPEEDPSMNFVHSPESRLTWIFKDHCEKTDDTSEDTNIRSTMMLKKMVDAYLPQNWIFVACGITYAISSIVQKKFGGSEIIVIDENQEQTSRLSTVLKKIPHIEEVPTEEAITYERDVIENIDEEDMGSKGEASISEKMSEQLFNTGEAHMISEEPETLGKRDLDNDVISIHDEIGIQIQGHEARAALYKSNPVDDYVGGTEIISSGGTSEEESLSLGLTIPSFHVEDSQKKQTTIDEERRNELEGDENDVNTVLSFIDHLQVNKNDDMNMSDFIAEQSQDSSQSSQFMLEEDFDQFSLERTYDLEHSSHKELEDQIFVLQPMPLDENIDPDDPWFIA